MAVSLKQFVDRLVDSGLMSKEDMQALVDALPADHRPKDAQQLARILVRQKKLTAFQAQQIYAGKGKALVLGNYVILDKLGQGGMGMVLKAEHRRMKRLVALKILSPAVTKNPEALRRFQREVEAAAKLEHANIVTAYDADEANKTHFLVMQYVEGTDLSALVKEAGPLPVDQTVSCVLQAARGLEYAHARGVVHRDIKPSNLLLDPKGTVKILDMGLARLESAGAEQDQLTGTGQIMGTVDYMAPEQAMDTRTADARADVYALGITLWYLLTGHHCYDGATAVAKLMAHQSNPVPSLRKACPQASPELEAVFARMVAKTPEERYQSMTEVVADLDRCQAGPTTAPAVAVAPNEDSRLNAFLGGLDRTGGPTVGTKVTAKKKTAAGTPGVEPAATLQAAHVDTDPATQQPLVSHSASRSPGRRPGQRPWWRGPAVWLVAGGGALVVLVAAILFALRTKDGVIRVEINDPNVEVAIKGTEIVLQKADKGKDIKLSPGDHTLVVQRGDFKFETDKLILKKGETVTVRVELLAGKIEVVQGDKLIGQSRLPPRLAVAPFNEATAKRRQQEWADYLGLPVEKEVDLLDGEKLTMVLIPPGEFMMGSTEEEQQRFLEEARAAKDQLAIERISGEGPKHQVRITHPFYLGKYEVTQEQYARVMGATPNQVRRANQPVESVTWNDAAEFCKKLSQQEGKTYRLPTEAEWEYACRAGTTTVFHYGDSLSSTQANLNGDHPYGGAAKGPNLRTTTVVGSYAANGFGLHDMHGNVSEWCGDQYGSGYYRTSPVDDPPGPDQGSSRVYRGGSWNSFARGCRSAFRLRSTPSTAYGNLGFRVSLVPSDG